MLHFDELADPDVCLADPHCAYPEQALVAAEQVRAILRGFRRLRYADDIIYLRSESLNVFNGLVALNFSCDGSHYLPHTEFLDPASTFWQNVS